MLVNGADALMIDANGPFSFFTPVDDGVDFDVAVDSQPAGQICLISSGTGTVSGADVTRELGLLGR